jgi:hypothetical protein
MTVDNNSLAKTIHILRNGYGFCIEEKREAYHFAADQLELMLNLLIGSVAYNEYALEYGVDEWWARNTAEFAKIVSALKASYK